MFLEHQRKLEVFSGYRKKLISGKGIKIPLTSQQGRSVFLTPSKVYGENSPIIIIALEPSKLHPKPGVFPWNPKCPPPRAILMAIYQFPINECSAVHALMCMIFFPLKPIPDSQNPSRLIDWPKRKFAASYSKPKKKKTKKTKVKKSNTTKSNDSSITPTAKQLSASARATKTRRATIEAVLA